MNHIVTEPTATAQWKHLVHEAEERAHLTLNETLESYLVFTLMRFTQRPQLVNGIMALEFLNSLRADHLVLELAHRPSSDLEALKGLDPRLGIGLGVVDIKVNHIETPEEIANAIERAEKTLGAGRVQFIHPDCGFWMLKRSVADRKIAVLAKGRDLYLGRA